MPRYTCCLFQISCSCLNKVNYNYFNVIIDKNTTHFIAKFSKIQFAPSSRNYMEQFWNITLGRYAKYHCKWCYCTFINSYNNNNKVIQNIRIVGLILFISTLVILFDTFYILIFSQWQFYRLLSYDWTVCYGVPKVMFNFMALQCYMQPCSNTHTVLKRFSPSQLWKNWAKGKL